MAKLTALRVRTAKKPGRYQDGLGLMLLVKSASARSWLLRIQVGGQRRDFGLGSAASVSLQEARAKALELRKLYQSGVDPVSAKRAARAAQMLIPTFREAAKRVHEEHQRGWRNEKHIAQWISSLEAYAFPALGDLRVDQIDGAMIRDLLAPIWLKKAETARRVRQRVGSVLDWAHAKGYRLSEAPMRSVGKGLPKQPKKDRHFAAMAYSALPEFMTELGEKADSIGRLALRFLILTAARSGEVRGATWEEVDLDNAVWTIPASRMKAGRNHMVPLSKPALAVLDIAAKARTGKVGEPIFPGMNGVMSDMTLSKVLRTADVGRVTVHGFRSSFRDWAAECTTVQGEIVESALAHTVANRVEAAYRRTSYLEKRRSLMDTWANFLTKSPPKILKLPARR